MEPAWMHYTPPPSEKKKPIDLSGISLPDFDNIIEKIALSNEDRHAAAVEKADSYSFQVSNPWFKSTDANIQALNKWLTSKGIRYSTYPEIAEAAEELASAGLVSVDDAAYASHLDGVMPTKFRGAITQRDYDSLDGLISNERAASIRMLGTEKKTDQELAVEQLSAEDIRQMIRKGEKQHQAIADGKVSTANADAWIVLHPEFRDDTANGKRLALQLHLNGVVNRPIEISDYELAHRQLLAQGEVRQNPAQLRKQEAQAVLDRAQAATNEPGSVFDNTSIEEMESMSMDELRKRAEKQLASRR
jgi:hypothetical protein